MSREDKLSEKFEKQKALLCVIVESPFAGGGDTNLAYLRAALNDCFMRREAPFASHGLYTQPGVLDDSDKVQRRVGIEAGMLWGVRAADKIAVYTDLGITEGMKQGIARYKDAGIPIEYRTLYGRQ